MNTVFEKLFLTHSYFTIALRHRSEQSVLADATFQPEYVLPANVLRWAADPILAEDRGKTWLFYEAVEQDHGHIEVAEVLPDCTLGTPTVLLRDACHYSYPFVFRWEDSWYLIPESSAEREVRLYRAEEFPRKWTLQQILLRERAVDTTVYARDGSLFLLTFLIDGATERVHPQSYRLQLRESGAELSPCSWENADELRVRGAGPAFAENGVLYRPVQVNREQRYGDAVAVCQMRDEASAHTEQAVGILKTPLGKCGRNYFDGAHTYCRSSRYEVVDLRCRDFDLWKLPRRLISRRK